MDVATPDQIPELVSHFTESPFYRQFRSKDEKDAEQYSVSAVFHLCGDEVLEDPLYKEFMNGFPDTTNVSRRSAEIFTLSHAFALHAACRVKQEVPVRPSVIRQRGSYPMQTQSAGCADVPHATLPQRT